MLLCIVGQDKQFNEHILWGFEESFFTIFQHFKDQTIHWLIKHIDQKWKQLLVADLKLTKKYKLTFKCLNKIQRNQTIFKMNWTTILTKVCYWPWWANHNTSQWLMYSYCTNLELKKLSENPCNLSLSIQTEPITLLNLLNISLTKLWWETTSDTSWPERGRNFY